MKRTLLLIFALAPLLASADVTKDGIFYRCYEDGAYVTQVDKSVTGDVVIPASVTDTDGEVYTVVVVDENAFQERTITAITLPAGIRKINEDAFSACSSLKDFTLLGATPPTVHKEAFDSDAFSKIKIHVTAAALDTYKGDTFWKQFTTIDDKAAAPTAMPRASSSRTARNTLLNNNNS